MYFAPPPRDSESYPPTLPTRTLGRTQVRVPILGFGTASCGIRRNLANAVALYQSALDAGISYFDTAPLETGYGKAQEQLGYALEGRRRGVFLVTKCHESQGDDALRMLDRNLRELRTDYADLVHIHSLGDLDVDTVLSRQGILAALTRARREGRIRFIGLSGHHRPAHFVSVLQSEWADQIDVVMNAVNFADHHTYNFEERVWPIAQKRGIGLVAMKVFGGADWNSHAMSNAMVPQANKAQALRYALSVPHVAVAVVGMATEEELRQNLAWARAFTPLTDSERAALLRGPGRQLAARWGAHFGSIGV